MLKAKSKPACVFLKIILILFLYILFKMYVSGKSDDPTDVDYVPTIFSSVAYPKTPPLKRKSTNSSNKMVEELGSKRRKKIQPKDCINVWDSDHDYCFNPSKKCSEMSDYDKLLLENERLKKEVNGSVCDIEQIIGDKVNCLRYTGLPCYEVFDSLVEYLFQQAEVNFARFSLKKKSGPKKKLTFSQELLLVLARLKTGMFQFDLANRFQISEGQVSKLFCEWINFLFLELKMLFECPDSESVKANSSQCFDEFKDVKMVIDCTEIFTQQPKKSQSRKEVYSNYKSHNAVKFLVGMSPNLGVTYVSKGWGGRASDTHITINSDKFLENMKPGDQVMADRGFGTNKISDQLASQGVEIVMPSFKGRNRSQLSRQEVLKSEECSKVRIHIERMIQRIKCWHILDREQQLKIHDIIEQVFTVVAYMSNFQTSIIKPRQK